MGDGPRGATWGFLAGLLVGVFAGYLLHGLPAGAPDEAAAIRETSLGRTVYDRSCAVCHTLRPPPRQAPPVVGMMDVYRDRFESVDSAVGHIRAFVPSPSREGTVLPAEALERWGLMPPMPLAKEELEAVARWMWEQYDPDFEHPRDPSAPGRTSPPGPMPVRSAAAPGGSPLLASPPPRSRAPPPPR